MRDVARDVMPYLLTLANGNNPVCRIAQGGQGKYSQVALSSMVLLTNIANGNNPMCVASPKAAKARTVK